jgi:hypothetical protein
MMELYGFVIYDTKRYYRIWTWNGDFLIPWDKAEDPTPQEAYAAVNTWWKEGKLNSLGIVKL